MDGECPSWLDRSVTVNLPFGKRVMQTVWAGFCATTSANLLVVVQTILWLRSFSEDLRYNKPDNVDLDLRPDTQLVLSVVNFPEKRPTVTRVRACG